jgi:hypothetical protein
MRPLGLAGMTQSTWTTDGGGSVVRPERFELPTYFSGGLDAQEINNLAGFV